MVGPDFEVHPHATRIAIAMDKNLAMDVITGISFLPVDYRPRRILRKRLPCLSSPHVSVHPA
jgi:hypothetical protein